MRLKCEALASALVQNSSLCLRIEIYKICEKIMALLQKRPYIEPTKTIQVSAMMKVVEDLL